jgi:hypothetical protein
MAALGALADRRDRAVEVLDRFLFVPGPVGRVRTMRVLLAALIALRVGLGPYRGLAGQPEALFRPVWFLAGLPHMPSVGQIVAVQVVGVLAALLAVVGWRERWTFAVGWASLLVLGGLRASRAKIMHNDVLLLLVGAVIVLAPVGGRALDRRRRPDTGWPAQAALLVVGGAYFLTGFQKVVASGPAWVISDNLRVVMYRAAGSGKAPTDAVALFIADRAWLAHVLALATIVVELGGLAIWRWARLRPWYWLATAGLHVGIYLTHGLDYWAWIATTGIVLVDWSAVAARFRGGHGRAEAEPG